MGDNNDVTIIEVEIAILTKNWIEITIFVHSITNLSIVTLVVYAWHCASTQIQIT